MVQMAHKMGLQNKIYALLFVHLIYWLGLLYKIYVTLLSLVSVIEFTSF
jgi:hypothetical protein